MAAPAVRAWGIEQWRAKDGCSWSIYVAPGGRHHELLVKVLLVLDMGRGEEMERHRRPFRVNPRRLVDVV